MTAVALTPEVLADLNAQRARRGLMGFVKSTHPGYLAGWVHQRICSKLEAFSAAVARKESPRLIIVMPPRHGKTAIVSQRWPIFHMVKYPGHEFVCASYGQKLANKNSRKSRTIARSKLAGMAFGDLGPKLKPKKGRAREQIDDDGELIDAVEEWTIKNGSSYQAVGVGAGLTGNGAHVLLIDDYCKDRKAAESKLQRDTCHDWYGSTAYTRLAPGGGVLVMATRWHDNDLIGRLLEAQEAGGDRWEVLHFEAIATEDEPVLPEDAEVAAMCSDLAEDSAGRPCWRLAGQALHPHPERWPLERLERRRGVLSSRDWEALFQGRPVSAAGDFIKRFWFRERYTCTPADIAATADEVWVTSDAAKKALATSDFHACHVWARKGNKFYPLDRVTERVQYPEYEQMLDGFIARWAHFVAAKGSVMIEDTANGTVYMQNKGASFKGCYLVPFQPTDSKTYRATFLQRAGEAGAVILPDSGMCPWAEEMLDVWCAYSGEPTSTKDDDVDAASMIIMRWTLEAQVPESTFDQNYW